MAAAKQYGHVILNILCYLWVLRKFFYSRKNNQNAACGSSIWSKEFECLGVYSINVCFLSKVDTP